LGGPEGSPAFGIGSPALVRPGGGDFHAPQAPVEPEGEIYFPYNNRSFTLTRDRRRQLLGIFFPKILSELVFFDHLPDSHGHKDNRIFFTKPLVLVELSSSFARLLF
jgi:hypothetical protein